MMKTILVFLTFALLFIACKTTDNTTKKDGDFGLDLFYGLWKVTAFRFEDGRVMPGEFMGYPQYEFSKEGNRIKNLDTKPAPPADTVAYKIAGDSISYPNNPKYPVMKITKLTKDTLVLSNSQMSWYLHR